MNDYISVGIAKVIYINADTIEDYELFDLFEKEFNFDLYDIYKIENYFVLSLKKKILEDNIIDLLEEIKELSDPRLREGYTDTQNILRGKSYTEMIKLGKEKSLSNFKIYKDGIHRNDTAYLLRKNITSFSEFISIEEYDKIYFLGYKTIFNIFRTAIADSINNVLSSSICLALVTTNEEEIYYGQIYFYWYCY